MAQTQQTAGIVIAKMPYRESDAILTIFSREYGKITVVARAARVSSKRFAGKLDLFDTGECLFSEGRSSLKNLSEFRPTKTFNQIRTDLDKFVLASLLAETIDRLNTHETTQEELVFDYALHAFMGLEAAEELRTSLKITYYALAELLELSGYLSKQTLPLPSAKNLLQLMSKIESTTEKPLLTKNSVLQIINAWKAGSQARLDQ